LGAGNLLLTVAECFSQFNDMVNEREKPAAYTQHEGATHDVHENKGSEKFLLEQTHDVYEKKGSYFSYLTMLMKMSGLVYSGRIKSKNGPWG
jgi:hypothetical protein